MISADIVARAMVASANHYGVCPVEAMSGRPGFSRVRLAAAIGIARKGLLSNRASARICGVSSPNMLSPSMWPKQGVTPVVVDIVVDVLGGAPLPPKPRQVARSARPAAKVDPKPKASKDTGPGYEPAGISIDVVARRQRDRMNEGLSFHRTEQDRKPIKGTVTAKLMGDPPADRDAASRAAWERIQREEAKYGAKSA